MCVPWVYSLIIKSYIVSHAVPDARPMTAVPSNIRARCLTDETVLSVLSSLDIPRPETRLEILLLSMLLGVVRSSVLPAPSGGEEICDGGMPVVELCRKAIGLGLRLGGLAAGAAGNGDLLTGGGVVGI